MNQELTHKELLRQLDYNSLTGIFYWKIANRGITKGNIAGTKTSKGYIQIGVENKLYLAHRLAWFYEKGYMPENMIDHKDRIRHHNWSDNLREVSDQCSGRNRGLFKNNTSGIKGVCFDKANSKWKAQMKINRKVYGLGYYKDFDNAVCARLAGEQCVDWEGCDSCSPAYLYVKRSIQN